MNVREAQSICDGINAIEMLRTKAYVFEEEPDDRGEYYVQALTPVGPQEFHTVDQAIDFMKEQVQEVNQFISLFE